jgi:hypothetical protein
VQAFITEVAYEIDEISDIDFMEYLIREKPECKDILFKR